MRTFYLIFLVLWILGGSYFAKNTFCPSDKAKKPAATTTAATGAAAAATKGGCDRSIAFADGDFKVTSSENFLFDLSGFNLKQDPSSALQDALTKVADYLNDNADKTLQFDGLYSEGETNTSSEDNLGLARSQSIKDYVVREFGVNEDQIILGSKMTNKTKNVCFNKDSKTITKGALATFGAQ